MDIQRAKSSGVEQRRREDQSIRRDDDGIGAQRPYVLDRLPGLQRSGLQHGDAACRGQALDWTWLRRQTAARRPVGLRQDRQDVVACGREARQRPFCELGGAGED